jgi:FHS family L-fucose permease-like MFS transporter
MAGILLWLNLAVLSLSMGMIASAIASIFSEHLFLPVFAGTTAAVLLVLSLVMFLRLEKMSSESIWSRPHFSGATLDQFFYVAAQSGIFAYFINHMTTQPPVPVSNATASTLASVGLACFLAGRFIGAGVVKKFSAHTVLGIYGAVNVLLCACVMLRLDWESTVCVFLAFFYVDHVPDHLCLGNFQAGGWCEKGIVFYRHGDHGRGNHAKAHGTHCRHLECLAQLYRSSLLFLLRGSLRVFLEKTRRFA